MEKIVIFEKGKISYPFLRKTYKDEPEERVRAKVVKELIFKYKYSPKCLDIEVYPPRREPKLPADIVVYEDEEHEQVFLVVEVKADSTLSKINEAKREGLGNANLLNARYLLLTCGNERLAYNLSKHPSLKKLDKFKIVDIPVKYGEIPEFRFKKGDLKWDLRKASFSELNNKFQLCHNEIWEGGKRDPAIAFDEISKLLLTKIWDERFTPKEKFYRFQVGKNEKDIDVTKRVLEIYKEVQEREPDVFKEKIKLPSETILRIVEILQDISLLHTDLDSKGRAFENFLGKLFRGEYGQYFTPRRIVEFMVSFLNPSEKDLIIDPACGSGGFLLYCWKHVKEKIAENYANDLDTIKWIDFSFSHKQLFGIEINDRIARVAMMDMVIHEDGHSNIECNDALEEYSNFDPKKDIIPNKYDIVITNPPFGAVVKRKEILKKFDLGKTKVRQRTEILFIERCIELTKAGKKIGIVIPNSILNNPTESYVRDFIKKNCEIIGIIGVPIDTFKSAGANVRASLVFLKKRMANRKPPNKVFFAKASSVGFDASGKETEENDLHKIVEAFETSLKKDIIDDFVSIRPYILWVNSEKLEDNLTADYYIHKTLEKTGTQKYKKLNELAAYREEKIKPKDFPDQIFKTVSIHFDGTMSVREEKGGRDFKYLYQYVMKEGDVVLSRIDCSNGAVSIVPKDLDGAVCSGEFYVLIPKDVSPIYLWITLRSKNLREQMLGLSSGMTGRHRIKREQLMKLKIPIISKEILDEFINKMGKALNLETLSKKKKEEAFKIIEDIFE